MKLESGRRIYVFDLATPKKRTMTSMSFHVSAQRGETSKAPHTGKDSHMNEPLIYPVDRRRIMGASISLDQSGSSSRLVGKTTPHLVQK